MSAAAVPRLRFVHVSDLHIGRRRRWRQLIPIQEVREGLSAADPEILQQLAIETAHPIQSRQAQGAVHCIASGDLSSLGGKDEIRDALAYLHRQLARVGAGLDYRPVGHASHVLGNHDVWGGGLLRGVFKSSKKRVEKQLWSPEHPRTYLGDSFYADLGALRVRVYLADSTKAGFGNVLAGGRLSDPELAVLRQCVTSDEKADRRSGVSACLRVLVMHHPLSLEPGLFGAKALDDADMVGQRLRHMGFGLVLCGHEHGQNVMLLPRCDIVECIAGTASQGGNELNTYLLHDVDGFQVAPANRDLRVHVRIAGYARRSGEFRFSARQPSDNSVRVVSLL